MLSLRLNPQHSVYLILEETEDIHEARFGLKQSALYEGCFVVKNHPPAWTTCEFLMDRVVLAVDFSNIYFADLHRS
jgi:hypothetical protein